MWGTDWPLNHGLRRFTIHTVFSLTTRPEIARTESACTDRPGETHWSADQFTEKTHQRQDRHWRLNWHAHTTSLNGTSSVRNSWTDNMIVLSLLTQLTVQLFHCFRLHRKTITRFPPRIRIPSEALYPKSSHTLRASCVRVVVVPRTHFVFFPNTLSHRSQTQNETLGRNWNSSSTDRRTTPSNDPHVHNFERNLVGISKENENWKTRKTLRLSTGSGSRERERSWATHAQHTHNKHKQ